MACATSAMRESKNGQEITRKVNEAFGLKINIIDGSREAEIINRAFSSKLDDKKYLHIDVGGGSTELILYINKQQIMAKSFKIGSVRRLGHHESPQVFKKMTDWVEENVRQKFGNVIAIGTGGNINKVLELAKKKSGKFITLEKIEEVQQYVAGFSLEERVNFLQLNPDRADVIIPASEIYTAVMRSAKAKKILVPDVGLKDGMMQIMYERNLKKRAVM
jgi:exopolyphosphatase/guanosine-5'-triphosphate,3'-diphosphate pyrophosphatase